MSSLETTTSCYKPWVLIGCAIGALILLLIAVVVSGVCYCRRRRRRLMMERENLQKGVTKTGETICPAESSGKKKTTSSTINSNRSSTQDMPV